VCSSVDIVAEKKIAGIRQLASDFKDFEDIVELAMNVTDYCNWGLDVVDIFLLDENIFEFVTN
jgi:hypothetical protein